MLKFAGEGMMRNRYSCRFEVSAQEVLAKGGKKRPILQKEVLAARTLTGEDG
jgi:hypothetical protein